MNLRTHTAKQYREIRRILRGNPPIALPDSLQESPETLYSASAMVVCMILAAFLLVFCSKASWGDCGGLSPELQKAYQELKQDGFNVSCRKGL